MRLTIFICCACTLITAASFAAIPIVSPSNDGSTNAGGMINSTISSMSMTNVASLHPNAPKRDYITILGIGKGEVLDYKTQEFEHFDIQPLKQDVQLKKGLSTIQYNILVTGLLNSLYPDKFGNSVFALRYFTRCLAEYAYSYNGFVSKDFYSQMISRYNNYLIIDDVLRKTDIPTDIKYSLAKLYALGCVYSKEIKLPKPEIEKISRIPKDAVLYFIEEQAGELYNEGEFSDIDVQGKPDDNANLEKDSLGNSIGYDHGENLYYICLTFYPKFKNMPKSAQIKFINDVYAYNPTLMLPPPIKRNRFAWDYFINWLWPKPNPALMKYCLMPYFNWLILPKTL